MKCGEPSDSEFGLGIEQEIGSIRDVPIVICGEDNELPELEEQQEIDTSSIVASEDRNEHLTPAIGYDALSTELIVPPEQPEEMAQMAEDKTGEIIKDSTDILQEPNHERHMPETSDTESLPPSDKAEILNPETNTPTPPDRPPTSSHSERFDPDKPNHMYYPGIEETYWAATDTEPGQYRQTIITKPTSVRSGAAETAVAHTADGLVKLQNEGMGPILEQAGIRASYNVEDAVVDDTPVTVRSVVVELGSAKQLSECSKTFAEGAPDDTRFTVVPTEPGKFTGEERIARGAQGEWIIASEDPSKDLSRDDSWHDSTFHLPALYCMPPPVTACIYDEMRDAQRYMDNVATMDDGDRDKNYLMTIAQERIDTLAGKLELINRYQVEDILEGRWDGTNGETLTAFLSEIMYAPRDAIRQAIINHVRNPRPENVLVRVWP